MKLGVIFAAYSVPEYINQSLNPWIEAKKRYNISIAAVSCVYKEYAEMNVTPDLESPLILKNRLDNKEIDYLYTGQSGLLEQEHVIRNYALQYLLNNECDYILILDSDEFYSSDEIDSLISYINRNQMVPWFKIEFKNVVFDGTKYVKGFCPPRIFKTEVKDFKINRLYWDNDLLYLNKSTKQELSHEQFASVKVPIKLVNPKHMTWLNDLRSKLKIEYQRNHFSSNGCSYKWNDEENRLEFDYDFYKRTGQQVPEVVNI